MDLGHAYAMVWSVKLPKGELPKQKAIAAPTMKLILLSLWSFAKPGDTLRPRVDTIAERCNGLNEKTVRNGLSVLEALGIVETVPDITNSGYRGKIYRVVYDRLLDFVPEDKMQPAWLESRSGQRPDRGGAPGSETRTARVTDPERPGQRPDPLKVEKQLEKQEEKQQHIAAAKWAKDEGFTEEETTQILKALPDRFSDDRVRSAIELAAERKPKNPAGFVRLALIEGYDESEKAKKRRKQKSGKLEQWAREHELKHRDQDKVVGYESVHYRKLGFGNPTSYGSWRMEFWRSVYDNTTFDLKIRRAAGAILTGLGVMVEPLPETQT